MYAMVISVARLAGAVDRAIARKLRAIFGAGDVVLARNSSRLDARLGCSPLT